MVLLKISFMVFFLAIFYILYQGYNFYLIFNEIKKDILWLKDKNEKILLLLSICYVFTVIFTGISII